MSGRTRHRSPLVVQGKAYKPGTDRIRRPVDVDVDWATVAQLRTGGGPSGLRLPPTGTCHDCGQLVTGERRFCGRCLTHH